MTTNRRLSLPASFESKEGGASLPRYLQASLPGSCHDLCKYGKHHHKLEKNHEKPFPKRAPYTDQTTSANKPSTPRMTKTKAVNTSKPPSSPRHQTKLSSPTVTPRKKPPPVHPKEAKSSPKVLPHPSKSSKKASSSSSLPSKLPEEKTLYVVTDERVGKSSSKETSESAGEKKGGKVGEKRGESKGPRRVRREVEREEGVKLKFKGGVGEKEVEEEIEGEKVVLRHQDVEEKDPQGLLNNVIEETASKLVETRKSKVKALVGAFETVISLQDASNIVH